MSFHINPVTGNSGECKAEKDGCPFGKDDEHYTTAEAARNAFENRQETFADYTPLKTLTFNGNTWKNVSLEGTRYADGSGMAIVANTNGEPLADISVNLEGIGIRASEGAFFVKDWSENSGLAGALEKAGVVQLTGRKEKVNQWGSEAIEVTLTPKCQYLAVGSDWIKSTKNENDVVEEKPNPLQKSTSDFSNSISTEGLDHSVHFEKDEKGETITVISDNDGFYSSNKYGTGTFMENPISTPRIVRTPSPKMAQTLKNITNGLIQKDSGYKVKFDGDADGLAKSATIESVKYNFTINSDGSFAQKNK